MVMGASSVLASLSPLLSTPNRWDLQKLIYLFSTWPGVLVILTGIGICRQMRMAFIGGLAVIPVALAWSVGTVALSRSGSMHPVASTAWAVMASAVQWWLIWAIWRRGEAAGVVHPLRTGKPAETGYFGSDALAILVRGVGYLQLAAAASLGMFAFRFLIPHPGVATSRWDLYSIVIVACAAIEGLLGLALLLRMRAALLVLAAVFPLASAIGWVALLIAHPGITNPFTSAFIGIAANLANGILLYRLYRRTAPSLTAS